MVESKSARDMVEAGAHELDGLLESLLNLRHGEAIESGEVRRLREVNSQAAQQPVACEVVSLGREAIESLLHLIAHGGPFRANLGEREVALAKLRAARVHAVEDIHTTSMVLSGPVTVWESISVCLICSMRLSRVRDNVKVGSSRPAACLMLTASVTAPDW